MKKYIHAVCVGLFIIYFISSSGLFTSVAYAMKWTPKTCCSNVAFIPGLEASRLYAPGLISENKLWEPNTNADADKLAMDVNGKSVRSDIYTKDVIDNVGALFWKSNVYDGFIKYMDGLVAEKFILNWATLPYDWRLGLGDVVNNGVTDENGHISYLSSTTPDLSYMVAKLQELLSTSISGRVTIVTHSNGGLVAKVLMQKLIDMKKANRDDNLVDYIDRVIMVAAPQTGAMDAVGSLLHGYKLHYLGGLVLNENHARAMAENMPGAYNLLPSQKYFESNVGPVITFATSTDTFSNLSKTYGRTVSNYDSLKRFLTGADGRKDPAFGDIITPNVLNQTLITNAENQHNNIDNWQFPTTTAVTQIAGVGIQTLSGLRYVKGAVCSNDIMICKDVLDPEPVFSSSGDGTVLSTSALFNGGRQLYFDLKSFNDSNIGASHPFLHSDILETWPMQSLIKSILNKSTDLPFFVYANKPQTDSPQLTVVAHSPIALNAYDAQGNHTGLIDNPDPNSDLQIVEQNIPNSLYAKFGEAKYLSLPATSSTTISFQGTDYGSFTLDTSVSQGGVVSASSTFVDIPVTPQMKGSVVSVASSTVLALDIDGDGTIDATTTPNKAFDPILYIEIMKKTIDSFNLKKAQEKLLIQRLNELEKKIKAGKIKNVEKQIKGLIKSVTRSNKKLRKITDTERNQLVVMLTNLVDNLK